MTQHYIPSILFVIVFYFPFSIVYSQQKVPLMLWSNDQSLQSETPQSLVDDVYPQDLLKMYQDDQIFKVVFVQKNMNIEQFSLAKIPFISKLFEENKAMFFPSSKFEPNFYSNFDTYIPLEGETLEQNEAIIKSYVEKFNQSDPVIFMLTGQKNALYESLDDDENDDNNKTLQKLRYRRKAEDKKDKGDFIFQYPSKDPCVFLHVSQIDLYDYKEEKPKKYEFNDISVSSVKCENSSEKSKSKLNANFIELNINSSEKKAFNVKLYFGLHTSMMWKISSIEVKEMDGENRKWWNINPNTFIEDGFSYSCSRKTYKVMNGKKYAKIVFHRFQIQPFVFEKSQHKFEESFDCSVWFTLPIFSSLLVCILLILILYYGIRALMSISTPDRFENPKSKGLILTGVEE